jgi:peptide-methionine (R)-S-oxide reductase
MKTYPVHKTEAEWLEQLGPDRYRILREKGTERPFTGTYNMHAEAGGYSCGACHVSLFESDTKFDSGCGWPSFDASIPGSVEYIRDKTLGMIRTEILCANCGSHLGHVFDDGPTESGQRYCVNSASIDFKG